MYPHIEVLISEMLGLSLLPSNTTMLIGAAFTENSFFTNLLVRGVARSMRGRLYAPNVWWQLRGVGSYASRTLP